MTVLSTSRPGAVWAEVGRRLTTGIGWLLFAVGWLTMKALRALATGAAAVLFAAGWVAGSVLWPATSWCGRAVRLGWQEGRKPIGGQRGTA